MKRTKQRSTNNDLWIVPVSGGEAKNITADNPASDSTPLYSPDGRYIAYRAQQRPGYESDRFTLMLYDRKTSQKTELTSRLHAMGRNNRMVAGFKDDLFQLGTQGPFADLCGPGRWITFGAHAGGRKR